jgi:hypothetical protein
MKGKGRMAALMLIGLLVLGGWEAAEARDHFYLSFGITLGGVTAGAAGIYFFFAGEKEIAEAPIPVRNALLNMGDNRLSWHVPELVIRTSDSFGAGPQGMEGYACLLKLRFP